MHLFASEYNQDYLNLFQELDDEQLDGLARLCFDLAKVSFVIALFPTSDIFVEPLISIMKIVIPLFTGLAFTYAALLLLKLKK